MNSICIATYNGEKYIREQLDSILSQITTDDEVIISDDGSTDSTIDIIKSYNDHRILLIKNNTKRHGCIGNFENALKFAKGEFIFLADQDDVWFEKKYKVMLYYLNDYSLVHCNSKITDENLKVVNDSFYSLYNNGTGILKNIRKSTYFGSHMAFHTSLLKYALPFPMSNEIGHDLWLGLIAEITGNCFFINEPLMFYRRHDTSFCCIFGKSKRPLYKKFLGRLIMLYNLTIFLLKYISHKYNKILKGTKI